MLSGALIARALSSRFGTSFHGPNMNGRFWRAAHAVLGLPLSGSAIPAHIHIPTCFVNEADFTAEVQLEVVRM